jgi:hypothetical protein
MLHYETNSVVASGLGDLGLPLGADARQREDTCATDGQHDGGTDWGAHPTYLGDERP